MLDKKWVYYDHTQIYYSTLTHLRDGLLTPELSFNMATRTTGSYPRFNKDTYVASIVETNGSFLPDYTTNYTFSEITDKRSIDLLEVSKSYETIYFFYSGGIDSTVILCSLLKHWKKQDLEKIVLIISDYSIIENPLMYEMYIKDKFKTESLLTYFNQKRLCNQYIYVTGDCADPLLDNECSFQLVNEHGPILNDPYVKHKDTLINFFSKYTNTSIAELVFEMVVDSINLNKIHVTTVHEFLWYINFNWGYDVDLYHIVWPWHLTDGADVKKFFNENLFLWYNTIDYQNYSVNRVGNKLMGKLDSKEYIYQFNNDKEYYLNMIHKGLGEQYGDLITTKFCGIDSDYNIYLRPNIKNK